MKGIKEVCDVILDFLTTDVDLYILPLLTLLVALFPIVKDQNESLNGHAGVNTPLASKKRWSKVDIGLCVMLAFLALATWSSAHEKVKSGAKENQDLKDILTSNKHIDSTTTETMSDVIQLLASIKMISGRSPDKPMSVGEATTSVKAQSGIDDLTEDVRKSSKNVLVRIFQKNIDRELVLAALGSTLKDSGLRYDTNGVGNPSLVNHDTNSVRYGASVPINAVKLVSLALLRGGTTLRRIAPLDPSRKDKVNMIEVIAEATADKSPPITVSQVNDLK